MRKATALVAAVAGVLAVIVVTTGPSLDGMLHADDRHTNDDFPHQTIESNGYDSQFFYRLAVDPFSTDEWEGGVRFDSGAYRQQRIGYPALAWVISGGQQSLVPWALVVVNVAAFSALAGGAAVLAARAGRSMLWGLALVAYPGFVLALRWNLAEVVAGAFLVWALVMFRSRPWAAGALLAGAVLTRETSIIVPLALSALSVTRHRVPVPIWGLPVGVAAVWQSFLWMRWGEPGPTSQPVRNIGAPFGGVVDFMQSTPPLGDVVVFGLLVGLGVVAGGLVRHVDRWLALAWLAAATLPVMASYEVWWRSLSFTRAAMELVVLTLVVLLEATHPVTSSSPDGWRVVVHRSATPSRAAESPRV